MIDQLKEDLTDIECQWLIRGSAAAVKFEGQLKEIALDNFFDSLSITITSHRKGKYPKGLKINVNEPITIKKENDSEKLRYTIFSNEEPALIVGYVKKQS